MKDEIGQLIRAGLYQDNLRELISLCKAYLTQSPSLYGSLILIFESLADEYDNQGISVERYKLILERIQGPILLLLEEEGNSSRFVKRLDAVFEAFAILKGY